jgi:hypothetical protein
VHDAWLQHETHEREDPLTEPFDFRAMIAHGLRNGTIEAHAYVEVQEISGDDSVLGSSIYWMGISDDALLNRLNKMDRYDVEALAQTGYLWRISPQRFNLNARKFAS